MVDEASIRMTVDSSPAITENQKYVRAATETFNILQEKSRQLNVSERERVQWMEREIQLMQERSRLSTAETVNRLYEDPRLSTKDRAKLVRETRVEGREDIEELKLVNKNIKQLVNDQKIAQQKAERLGESFTRFLPGLLSADTAGGVAASGTGMLGALGVVGVLAGITIAKEIRGAATMEPAVRDYAILTGRNMLSMNEPVTAASKMGLGAIGMLPSQYFINSAQLLRAGGGNVREGTLGIMEAEKATGLSRATTAGLLGAERYGSGTVTNVISVFERYLRETKQNIAVLPEILQMFAGEATRMIGVAGRVDSSSVAAAIATIGKSFGLTGAPLQTVFGAMTQGLQQSTNPTIQAMQFAAMGNAMPGASLWQMQMAMENPMENPAYVRNMMDLAKKTSPGGREGYARNLQQLLGVSANFADILSRGEYNPETFAKEAARYEKTGIGGYGGRARGLTGATEKVSATIQGEWEASGFKNAQAIAEALGKLLGGMTAAVEAVNANRDDIKAIAADMKAEADTTTQFLPKILLKLGEIELTNSLLPGLR
jgi:hypothetical protein